MFASLWDDGVLLRKQFLLAEEEAKEQSEKMLEEEQRQKTIEAQQQRAKGAQQQRTRGAQQQRARGVQQRGKWEKQTEEGARHPEAAGARSPETEGAQQPIQRETEIQAQKAVDAQLQKAAAEEAKIIKAKEPQISQEPQIQAAEAAVQPVIQEEPWAVKWKFILENYPVLTPFEGEEEIQCVRLELKELRLLPKRHWYLGNNSFLLHGFFNYRYLILGAMKQEEEEEKKWFIGVPGVFQSQEKVMASIFGFPEYKSEKTAEQKTGQFGYWYRFLE